MSRMNPTVVREPQLGAGGGRTRIRGTRRHSSLLPSVFIALLALILGANVSFAAMPHFGGGHFAGPHFGGGHFAGPHFGGGHFAGPHFGGGHFAGPHFGGPHPAARMGGWHGGPPGGWHGGPPGGWHGGPPGGWHGGPPGGWHGGPPGGWHGWDDDGGWHAGWRPGWRAGWGGPGWIGPGFGWHLGIWTGGYWGGLYWPPVNYDWSYPWFLANVPPGAVVLTFDGVPYYYINQVYYTWSPYYNGYVASDPPPVANSGATPSASVQTYSAGGGRGVLGLRVIPEKGQSRQQSANDQYACHQWAARQSGFNPLSSAEDANASGHMRRDYRRAMIACLRARGYLVEGGSAGN